MAPSIVFDSLNYKIQPWGFSRLCFQAENMFVYLIVVEKNKKLENLSCGLYFLINGYIKIQNLNKKQTTLFLQKGNFFTVGKPLFPAVSIEPFIETIQLYYFSNNKQNSL